MAKLYNFNLKKIILNEKRIFLYVNIKDKESG